MPGGGGGGGGMGRVCGLFGLTSHTELQNTLIQIDTL